MSELTAARLRELLHYDPETGVFRWREAGSGRRRSGVAGGQDAQGYVAIYVDGRVYSAHRLAWLYVVGAWPARNVDHINGDKADNRLSNLRDVDQSVNMQNQKRAQRHNTTGLLGVSFDKSRTGSKQFRAIIWLEGKPRRLGWFRFAEDAHEAYLTAKRQLHEGCMI